MYGANTILTVYMAAEDKYSYELIRSFHNIIKRKWKTADVLGVEEKRVLLNNRMFVGNYKKMIVHDWAWMGRKTIVDYYDILGNPYYDYFRLFNSSKLDWWGTGKKKNRPPRNKISVPNTPMFDVSFEFEKNSLTEKMYLREESYDTARSSTFRGKQGITDMIIQIKKGLLGNDKMSEDEAFLEANRLIEVYVRNLALKKNPQDKNEYKFMVNYYNKHIHETRRKMMKFDINIWMLKELMSYNPNVSLFVLTPTNNMMRIQGLVGKRCKNTLMTIENPKYVYSMARTAKVKMVDKGWREVSSQRYKDIKIENPMYGAKAAVVSKRNMSEYLYDIIFEEASTNKEWVDKFHNIFQVVDYSLFTNLNGKDIVC